VFANENAASGEKKKKSAQHMVNLWRTDSAFLPGTPAQHVMSADVQRLAH